jgi:hypothetical protein
VFTTCFVQLCLFQSRSGGRGAEQLEMTPVLVSISYDRSPVLRFHAYYNERNYKLIAGDPSRRFRHRSASKTYASGSSSKSIPSSCNAQINLSISCVFSNSREVFRNPFWVAASAFTYGSDAMSTVCEGDVCVAGSETEDGEWKRLTTLSSVLVRCGLRTHKAKIESMVFKSGLSVMLMSVGSGVEGQIR